MSVATCPCCGQPLPGGYAEYAKVAERAGLSPRERQLFLAIAKGQGDAVARERVFFALWGNDIDGGPIDPRNVVYVTMARANAKLARLGYAIKTLRGFGYRVATVEAA